MKKKILVTGIIGIVGSLLMFMGDMLLYFTTQNINGSEKDFIRILGEVSNLRLVLGGLVGPLAAFMYFIGCYHLSLAIKPRYKKLRIIVAGLLCLGMTFGGAYHSHFTYLGFMSSIGSTEGLELIISTIQYYFMGVLIPTLIASVILIYLILKGKTYYPKWMAFFTPIVLMFAGEIFKNLPQPYLIVISGGWYNIMYILLFTLSLVLLLRKYEDPSVLNLK